LLDTTTHQGAVSLIKEERVYLLGLVNDEASKSCINGALAYLTYLTNFWMQEDLWRSWSRYGRIKAATRIGIPIDGVLPTTNHLEAFNGVIKNKYLPQLSQSGHCVDVQRQSRNVGFEKFTASNFKVTAYNK
jgi:hypothetical protein